MFLSTSNICTASNVSATGGNDTDFNIADMLSTDFTEQYVSLSSSTDFVITVTGTVRYIAFAGSDYFGKCQYVAINSDTTNEKRYLANSSATIVHVFPVDVVNPTITFHRGGFTAPITVSYLAAGQCWEVVNNGEQSGYVRPWGAPALKQRTSVNNGLPTVTVQEGRKISATLNIPNLPTVDAELTWYNFLRFAIEFGFFTVEDPSKGQYGYYCYNAKPADIKAHGQTRELQSASIKYDCVTGR